MRTDIPGDWGPEPEQAAAAAMTVAVTGAAAQVGALADEVALTGPDAERVGRYYDAALAGGTRRAYAAAWALFERWCFGAGRSALPAAPESVAAHLTALADAGRSASTVGKAAAAIKNAHMDAGLLPPTSHPGVVRVLRGIRNTIAEDPTRAPRPKTALLTPAIARMAGAVAGDGLSGFRDQAVILWSYASGMRRSETVGLDWPQLRIDELAVIAQVHRSKNDQGGQGRPVGVGCTCVGLERPSTCPLHALLAYRDALAAALGTSPAALTGPVWRPVDRHGRPGVPGRGSDVRLSADALVGILKRYAAAVGIDAAGVAGHSTRRGAATQALRNGAPLQRVANQLGQRALSSTRSYDADAQAAVHNLTGLLGL